MFNIKLSLSEWDDIVVLLEMVGELAGAQSIKNAGDSEISIEQKMALNTVMKTATSLIEKICTQIEEQEPDAEHLQEMLDAPKREDMN